MTYAYISDSPDPHSENPLSSEPCSYGLSPNAATPSPISQDAPADKNPRIVAALSALASPKTLLVPASGAKGEAAKVESQPEEMLREPERCNRIAKERAEKAMKERKQEAEEEEAQRIKAGTKAARQAAMKAERHRKGLEKIEQKQRKTENKKSKAEEKVRRFYLGGVAWGFDPSAGRRECGSSAEPESSSCPDLDHVPGTWLGAQSREDGNAMGGRTGRGENDKSVWGIESGAPRSDYDGHASYAPAARKRPPRISK